MLQLRQGVMMKYTLIVLALFMVSFSVFAGTENCDAISGDTHDGLIYDSASGTYVKAKGA